MKRFALCAVVLTVLACLIPFAGRAEASGGGDYTLIVAPARYSVLQVAFDLVNRHSAVLVSYQGEASTPDPRLHAWNGQEWVRISVSDYREVNFLQHTPSQTVLIGDDHTLPSVLVDASSWSPKIIRVTALDTATLVNEFGNVLEFRDSEWKWFAGRYNLDLTDENAAKRGTSWYDQPGPLPRDSAAKRGKAQSTEPVAAAPMTQTTADTGAAKAAPAAETNAVAPDAATSAVR